MPQMTPDFFFAAEEEGNLRVMGGQAGIGYEYGRLEILFGGVWSTICDTESFTPDSAQVACRILGYDGGAALDFRAVGFAQDNQVWSHLRPGH